MISHRWLKIGYIFFKVRQRENKYLPMFNCVWSEVESCLLFQILGIFTGNYNDKKHGNLQKGDWGGILWKYLAGLCLHWIWRIKGQPRTEANVSFLCPTWQVGLLCFRYSLYYTFVNTRISKIGNPPLWWDCQKEYLLYSGHLTILAFNIDTGMNKITDPLLDDFYVS